MPESDAPSAGSAATSGEPARPEAETPVPRPTRRLIVIQARVDSKRRIVSGEKATPVLDLDDEALVRELTPQGVIARGSEVDAVYETVDSAPARTASRRLVAIRVRDGSSTRVAVFVDKDDGGHPLAYALDGHPIGSTLLRYPVSHTAISSGFSYSRKHPITKKRRPHLGVDFAAPFGTPVVAVADGEVVFAKWATGFGRLIRIEHGDEYASAYAHLQRYAVGIKPGARVTKGQVIGYVGNSGQATGPHLHFVLLRGGKPIDPLGAGLPAPPRLVGTALIALHSQATPVEQILAAADRDSASATRLASVRR